MRSREQPAALDRAGVRRTEPFGRIVWATAIGIGYAVALIPGSLVHGVAFGAEHGDVNPLIHGGWDAAAALPFAVASLALWAFIVGLPSERGFVTSDSGSTPGQPGLTGPSSDLPEATTIDSQTFGPGEAFTEDILFGAGSRPGTVGDSIFHCHLYPHFAEGCWALYRVHDVLEDGTGITPDGIGVNSILPLPDHIAGCYRWCRGGRHDHAETAR